MGFHDEIYFFLKSPFYFLSIEIFLSTMLYIPVERLNKMSMRVNFAFFVPDRNELKPLQSEVRKKALQEIHWQNKV